MFLNPSRQESCIEIKINSNVYFHTSLWCLKRFYEGLGASKGFMKTFKVFMKYFEAPQRSVKIKI